MHENRQRDSHKNCSPLTSVTSLHLLLKQAKIGKSTALIGQTRWSTHIRICATPNLWHPSMRATSPEAGDFVKLMLLYPRMFRDYSTRRKRRHSCADSNFKQIPASGAASAECISLNCLAGCLTGLNKICCSGSIVRNDFVFRLYGTQWFGVQTLRYTIISVFIYHFYIIINISLPEA